MGLTFPSPSEYPEAYAPYIAAAGEGDVLLRLQDQGSEVALLFGNLTEVQGAFRYAEGKWSLKDLLQHCADAERIFAYRCLRIGRGDTTPLPGFDEDAYAAAAAADDRSMADLLADWWAARSASLTLFRGLSDGAWERQGTTNGRSIIARCFPFICAGHTAHHLAVVRERYLPSLK
ncbi:DinB family protein [Geothrix sp. 21YS21S-4]|uniref:DinB family protein n=1 Tax=Geothrix sp. 21YS21S-4 TaxID=3068889 RepID=UPI0027B93E69|nr:DinB family protein [Geothrix sp. 21YS21S-4]